MSSGGNRMKNKISKKLSILQQELIKLPENEFTLNHLSWIIQKLKLKKRSQDFIGKYNLNNKKYKLGQIVYVKCGSNIGAEYSGDHYALVVKSDNISSRTLNVVYLTSKKKNRKQIKLNKCIAEYIFDSLESESEKLMSELTRLEKTNKVSKKYKDDVNTLTQKISSTKNSGKVIVKEIKRTLEDCYVNLNNVAVISKNRVVDYDNKRLNNAVIPKDELYAINDAIKNVFFARK